MHTNMTESQIPDHSSENLPPLKEISNFDRASTSTHATDRDQTVNNMVSCFSNLFDRFSEQQAKALEKFSGLIVENQQVSIQTFSSDIGKHLENLNNNLSKVTPVDMNISSDKSNRAATISKGPKIAHSSRANAKSTEESSSSDEEIIEEAEANAVSARNHSTALRLRAKKRKIEPPVDNVKKKLKLTKTTSSVSGANAADNNEDRLPIYANDSDFEQKIKDLVEPSSSEDNREEGSDLDTVADNTLIKEIAQELSSL